MSTVSGRKPAIAPDEADPFRYGWRDVRTISPRGKVTYRRVPLTQEDVLHPQEGDHILENIPHDNDRMYLKSVFQARVAGTRGTMILSDCGVDLNIPGVRHFCPDIALVAGMRRYPVSAIVHLAREGARPLLLVEITSPSTRDNDFNKKVMYYRLGGVPWYLIVNATLTDEGERYIEFILYHKVGRGYRRIPTNEQGRVWLEPVQLWLGQTRDAETGLMRLACYDSETGKELGDYAEISRELEEAERARTEAERARTEAERARTEAERARTEAEVRAEAEARAVWRRRPPSAALRRGTRTSTPRFLIPPHLVPLQA